MPINPIQPIDLAIQPVARPPAPVPPAAVPVAHVPAPVAVHTNGNGRGLSIATFVVGLLGLIAVLVAIIVLLPAVQGVAAGQGVLTGEVTKVATAAQTTANNVAALTTSVDGLTTTTKGLNQNVGALVDHQKTLTGLVKQAIESDEERDKKIAARLKKIGEEVEKMKKESEIRIEPASPSPQPVAAQNWTEIVLEFPKKGGE